MPKSAAQRQRDRRQRLKQGWLIHVEVSFDLVDAMVDTGWLQAWDCEDKAAITAAVEKVLSAITRHA